jgi:hypothetical protein
MTKLLFASAVLAPTMLFAQGPFDGTWKDNPEQAKLPPEPTIFYLTNGIYDFESGVTKFHVKADGQDQSVSDVPYDTIAVKELDTHTIQVVTKKNGKTAGEQTRTVSDDGETLTYKVTDHPPDSDQTITRVLTFERVGKSPSGAHATSGSWRLQKYANSENGLLETYRSDGDELTYSRPTGFAWTAKPDGKEYPVKGSFVYDSVSLKQIGDHTIELSFKRGGKLMGISKHTVSSDGRKMTQVNENKLTGHVSTFVAEKQ